MNSVWRKETVSDIVIKYLDFRGKTPLKLGMNWGGGEIRALSANNVEMGKVNFNKECYFASEALYKKWMNKGDCEKGDILLTMEAPLGNIAQVPDNKKYILSQRTILLKTDKAKIDKAFLYYLLSGAEFQRKLQANSTGSTVTGIQQKKLSKISILYPENIENQEKIAKILNIIDAVIEKTEQAISKYQAIKKGMMHDLFTRGIDIKTGKLRPSFSDAPELYKGSDLGMIPVDWNVEKMGNIGDFKNGINKDKESFGFGIPFVNISDAFSETLKLEKLGKVNATEIEKKIYRLHKGDIIFVRSSVKPSGVGYNTLFTQDDNNIVYSGFMIRYRLRDKEEYIPEFYNQLFRYEGSRKRLLCRSTVSANTNINQENLKLINTFKLGKEEQELILKSIRQSNLLINKEQKTLVKHQKIKKGLMQDLLTGKVEVKV
tara:strand:- start:9115 stop:10410 length:1296 start_codon:yes stop_codon:yes gene_type:complete